MLHQPPVPDFTATASWPIRLEFFRGSHWAGKCLESIQADALKAGDQDVYWACQYALDTGDLTDLDAIFDAEAKAERQHEVERAYELRTGRELGL